MVFSLRDDPIMAAWDKFAERFSESMTKFADQFVEAMKQAHPKSDHDRRVLICGATQKDDCLCVTVDSAGSVYYDEKEDEGDVLDCEEEENHQTQLQIQLDDGSIVPKGSANEGFQTKIEDPNSPIHQVYDQLVHDRIDSLLENEFLSPSWENKIAVEMFSANKNRFSIAGKVFDKNTERNGYIVSLDPDPPDDYGTGLTINESNFSLHSKSPPITFTSGYGGISCLMACGSIDNFNVDSFQFDKQKADTLVKVYFIPYYLYAPISYALVIDGYGCQVFDEMPKWDKNVWKSTLGEYGLYWGERGKFKSNEFYFRQLLTLDLSNYAYGFSGISAVLSVGNIVGVLGIELLSNSKNYIDESVENSALRKNGIKLCSCVLHYFVNWNASLLGLTRVARTSVIWQLSSDTIDCFMVLEVETIRCFIIDFYVSYKAHDNWRKREMEESYQLEFPSSINGLFLSIAGGINYFLTLAGAKAPNLPVTTVFPIEILASPADSPDDSNTQTGTNVDTRKKILRKNGMTLVTTEFSKVMVKLMMVSGPKIWVFMARDAFVKIATACGYVFYGISSVKRMVREHQQHYIGTYGGVIGIIFCDKNKEYNNDTAVLLVADMVVVHLESRSLRELFKIHGEAAGCKFLKFCFWIRFKKIKSVLKEGPEDLESGDNGLYFPMVLVQIPMCNGKEVYQQFIAAVCNSDRPKLKLLIQVLDDSDDPTTQLLIKDEVHKWQQEGANILYQHRVIKEGYKAGNLIYTINYSYVKNYEFIANFYTDFQPTPEFLKKTVPHFKDNVELALVRTRWSFVSKDEIGLTMLQNINLAFHFEVEQQVNEILLNFFRFNVTGGVWKIKALEAFMGWSNNAGKRLSFQELIQCTRDLEFVMCLHVLAALYCNMGQYSEAIPFLEHPMELLTMDEGRNYALAKFAGCMHLGDTYAMLGQNEDLILCHTACLETQNQVIAEKDPQIGYETALEHYVLASMSLSMAFIECNIDNLVTTIQVSGVVLVKIATTCWDINELMVQQIMHHEKDIIQQPMLYFVFNVGGYYQFHENDAVPP